MQAHAAHAAHSPSDTSHVMPVRQAAGNKNTSSKLKETTKEKEEYLYPFSVVRTKSLCTGLSKKQKNQKTVDSKSLLTNEQTAAQ